MILCFISNSQWTMFEQMDNLQVFFLRSLRLGLNMTCKNHLKCIFYVIIFFFNYRTLLHKFSNKILNKDLEIFIAKSIRSGDRLNK